MLTELLIIIIIILIGSFIQGVSGFGFGLFAMGFIPLFFSVKESALFVMALSLVVSASIIFRNYKHILVKSLLIILSASLTGRIIAFFILNAYGEMDFMKKVLGLFLISIVFYLLLSNKEPSAAMLKTHIIPIIFGFFGGFIGGIFAVGGPFFVFYFLLIFNNKYRYSANLQVVFFVNNTFSLLLHGLNGDFNSSFLLYFIVGVVTVIIGTTLGLKMFDRLPRETIKKVAMIIVSLAGLNLIIFS
ncbi:hypothetical protein BKP37_08475 [Anaerobacillus alkalilacustris]|uniref:Probable membrane transporter protein n=1 Tax=Anaerobacillus alkalilacustris TaxID=393763 RepID=A0A1S2LQG7_9BACI|nr:sulfite exporter TauE/SafE family protein [Anaerobacillus alkalilacustris]OIJ14373.1 hypothetical protein BKP37_08475 [Anaerobacillus alkalilacustris]